MVTQPQKGKKELCNRTHKSKRKRQRKNEKRDFRNRRKSVQRKPEGTQGVQNEARLNALTEAKNVYYETLRSNEEKALNEVNTILDQATERVKTIITNTPDESFYRDIQIIKELNSMGLLSDEKKKAYLEKYKTCFEATLYLTNIFYKTVEDGLDNNAAIPDVGTGEPVKLLDIVRDELKQVLEDCKHEEKSLSVAIVLDGKASPLGYDLDRLDRVLDNYKQKGGERK